MVSRKDMIKLNQMKSIIWERGEVTYLELQNLMKPKLSIGLYNMYKPYLIAMFADSIGYDKTTKIWSFTYTAEVEVTPEGQTTIETSTSQ